MGKSMGGNQFSTTSVRRKMIMGSTLMLLACLSSITMGEDISTKIVNAPSSFYAPPLYFGNYGHLGLNNPGYGHPVNFGNHHHHHFGHHHHSKPGHVFVGYPNHHYNHGYNYPGYNHHGYINPGYN